MNCNKCLNEPICKFSEDVMALQAEVDRLRETIKVNNPVGINITCSRYQNNVTSRNNQLINQINQADYKPHF
jgi:nitrous oxidase accessory protein NosD